MSRTEFSAPSGRGCGPVDRRPTSMLAAAAAGERAGKRTYNSRRSATTVNNRLLCCCSRVLYGSTENTPHLSPTADCGTANAAATAAAFAMA